jgi:hypothetical protein
MKLLIQSSLLVTSALAFSPALLSQKMTTNPKTLLHGEYGASSTSFYTTTEKKDSYESLEDILATRCRDPKVGQVIKDMLDVCAEITEALRTALVTVEGSMNDFGDAQLSVDVSTHLLLLIVDSVVVVIVMSLMYSLSLHYSSAMAKVSVFVTLPRIPYSMTLSCYLLYFLALVTVTNVKSHLHI